MGYFPPGQGIRCTACNTVLKVDARRSTFVNLFTLIAWLAAIVSVDMLIPGAPILVSVIVAFASIIWVANQAHRLISLSSPGPGDDLLPDDECWPDRVGDEYVPDEEELREIEIVVGVPGESAGVDWTCSACGEANTKEFALCWNCGNAYRGEDT